MRRLIPQAVESCYDARLPNQPAAAISRAGQRIAIRESKSALIVYQVEFFEVIMPEPRQHAQSRGWIESIGRRIPGFKGYLEKEYRRDSDALQRTWLADRLQRAKRRSMPTAARWSMPASSIYWRSWIAFGRGWTK